MKHVGQKMLNGKKTYKKVKYWIKIFYLFELLVLGTHVTKISIKPVNNLPASK